MKLSKLAIEAAKRLIHTQMIGEMGMVRFAETIQEIVVYPLEKRIAELEVINEANERGILAQAKLIEELMADRDEWRTQHENLLEIRRQECQMIADRNQKISRLEKENEILILEKLKIVDIIEGCNRCYQKITRLWR
jgi:hypothetical protein